MQSKATKLKQWTTARAAITTQRTTQLIKQCKKRPGDEKIGYRNRNQIETRTGTVWAEEAGAGNANVGTGNQASTNGGRAWARAQTEENSIREWWCSFTINKCSRQITLQLDLRGKRDGSEWASRISHLLTPDRSTARFEVTPEVNRYSHFSRYRNSRDRSSSVEDRDVSPRAGLRYNSGFSGSSHKTWSWTTSTETFSSGRSGLVCSLLQWIDAQYQTQRRWATWRLYWLARQGQQFLVMAILAALWYCMGHSGEEVWMGSCDFWWTAEESSQSKSQTSQLNRSDQFHSYGFELCECAQKVQADWWSAIKLDSLYGIR